MNEAKPAKSVDEDKLANPVDTGKPASAIGFATRAAIATSVVVYALLVAHLLFIPYAFQPQSVGSALAAFSRIPWMQLGSDQNVAFVARAMMFLPLGLLLAVSFAPRPTGRARLLAALCAVLLGGAWAVAVNFAQLWFPSRTVNLNNVLAEVLGVAVGAFAWSLGGAEASRWWARLSAGGLVSLRAVLTAYVLLYLFASLTPFDFVTNARELSEKLTSSMFAPWTIAGGCGRMPCSAKYLILLGAAVPLGWWLALRHFASPANRLRSALIALAVSFAIESLQFLMVSGMSQGASLAVRAAGLMIGVEAYAWRHRLASIRWTRLADNYGRIAILAMLPTYFAAIAYVGGWFRVPSVGVAAGLQRTDVIVWMPFFYQYYEGYQSTMLSTMIHAALYAPVGVACWLWSHRRERVPMASAAVLAAVLSFVAESTKLFLVGRHPDYTDVLIAVVSASAALAVLRFVSRSRGIGAGEVGAVADISRPTPHDPAARVSGAHRTVDLRQPDVPRPDSEPIASGAAYRALHAVFGALALAIAAWTVIDFPLWRWQLAVGLAAYAALLVRKPIAYLIAVPALLPVLDLAPWSGRFFWDEFDALLAVTIGTRLVMGIPGRRFAVQVPRVAFGLLLLSVAISTVIGVWPLAPLDANAFSNYLSPYNALRVAKGYGWAALVVWLIVRDVEGGRASVPRLLTIGLAAGLATAAGGVFWERLSFLGSTGFDASFRAAGMVSATHVGGAYLEAMLVMLTPFALALAVDGTRRTQRIVAIVVVAAGALAVLMTVSRAAFAAWISAVATFFVVLWWKSRERPISTAHWRPGLIVGLTLLSVVAASAASIQSGFLRDRLAMSGTDLSVRIAHWRAAIDLIPRDAMHLLFGMGLGSFPREYYLAHANEKKLPAYRIEHDDETQMPFLVLAGGQGMYLDQRVDVRSGADLRFTGMVRASKPGVSLAASLCAKSFLNSTECVGAGVAADTHWREFSVVLKSPRVDSGLTLPDAPLSLSLHNGTFGARVEVARLSLRDGDLELLRNGSFRAGTDHWFVTSDVHLAWRVLDTPVEVIVEQGLLGLLAWMLVVVCGLAVVLGKQCLNVRVAGFAGGAVAFLAAGTFDTLLDAPRIVVLGAVTVALILAGREHVKGRFSAF